MKRAKWEMRPFLLLLAVLAAAAVSLSAAVATTKKRFGDDETVESGAADGIRHTPKDWGINGGQIYFDEISGEFKARPPALTKSSLSKGRPSSQDKDDDQSTTSQSKAGEVVSSVRMRGQSNEDAARLNKVLKRRKKWRKPGVADASLAPLGENEVEEGRETDGEMEEEDNGGPRGREDNAADDIVDKARGGDEIVTRQSLQ